MLHYSDRSHSSKHRMLAVIVNIIVFCLLIGNYKIMGSKYTKENTNKLIETTVFSQQNRPHAITK